MSDISELFDRDPLSLTDQDIIAIITRMREAQAQYELGVKAPAPKRAAAPKKSTLDILKDLDLT